MPETCGQTCQGLPCDGPIFKDHSLEIGQLFELYRKNGGLANIRPPPKLDQLGIESLSLAFELVERIQIGLSRSHHNIRVSPDTIDDPARL